MVYQYLYRWAAHPSVTDSTSGILLKKKRHSELDEWKLYRLSLQKADVKWIHNLGSFGSDEVMIGHSFVNNLVLSDQFY